MNERNLTKYSILNQIGYNAFITGMVVEISTMGSAMIDGIVVAKSFGAVAMAAYGISRPIFSITGIIAGTLGGGLHIVCSQKLSRNDIQGLNKIFSASFCIGALISGLLSMILLFFPGQMAAFMGAQGRDEVFFANASAYLRGIALMPFGLCLSSILAPLTQIDNNKRLVRIAALVQCAANVILDILAVVLGLGMFGIGLATSIVNLLSAGIIMSHLLKKNRLLHFVMPVIDPREIIDLLYLGSAKAVRRIGNLLRPLIVNRIILACGGVIAMSALSVRNDLFDVAIIPGSGLSEAIVMITSYCYGEKNDDGIYGIGKYIHHMIFKTSLFISGALLLFAYPIALFYSSGDPELRKLIVFSCFVMAVQVPLNNLVNCRIYYLQGIHQIKKMQIVIILSMLVCVVFCVYVMGNIFGVYGVLSGFAVSDLLVLVIIYVYHAVKSRKPLPSPMQMLELPEGFVQSARDALSLYISDRYDVSTVSGIIHNFCLKHGINRRNSYLVALSFEELSMNTIIHGFPMNVSDSPYIDTRITMDGNKLTIRMQDNCPKFDFLEAIKQDMENKDASYHIGLRILRQSMNLTLYSRSYDTNVIVIEYDIGEVQEGNIL
ncbi:MAG: MATE family efflux transporter [Eubacteriales bacterium]|nr:MATE family efflux transporter [Eubacteriales bacterium]